MSPAPGRQVCPHCGHFIKPLLVCLWCEKLFERKGGTRAKSGRTFCSPACSQRWRADVFHKLSMRARRNRGRRTRYAVTHP
jgi:hypothetical protein